MGKVTGAARSEEYTGRSCGYGLPPQLLGDSDVYGVVDGQHDNGWHVEAQSLPKPLGEILRSLAAPGRHPERLGELHEVWVAEVHPKVSAERLILLPHYGAVLPVLPHDGDEGCLQAHSGLQLLAVHQETSVAADGYDLAVWVDELGGYCGRNGEAHAGEPVSDENGVGLVGGKHAPYPKLMQPYIRDQDVLAAQHLADLVERPRRLDRELIVVFGMLEAAEHNPAQPIRAARARIVATLLAQSGESMVHVAHQLHVRDEVIVDLGRQGIYADNLLIAPGVPVAGGMLDEVVANRDHQISLLETGHLVVAGLQAH